MNSPKHQMTTCENNIRHLLFSTGLQHLSSRMPSVWSPVHARCRTKFHRMFTPIQQLSQMRCSPSPILETLSTLIPTFSASKNTSLQIQTWGTHQAECSRSSMTTTSKPGCVKIYSNSSTPSPRKRRPRSGISSLARERTEGLYPRWIRFVCWSSMWEVQGDQATDKSA